MISPFSGVDLHCSQEFGVSTLSVGSVVPCRVEISHRTQRFPDGTIALEPTPKTHLHGARGTPTQGTEWRKCTFYESNGQCLSPQTVRSCSTNITLQIAPKIPQRIVETFQILRNGTLGTLLHTFHIIQPKPVWQLYKGYLELIHTISSVPIKCVLLHNIWHKADWSTSSPTRINISIFRPQVYIFRR